MTTQQPGAAGGMQFDAVLFDLDDTLIDRRGAFRSWAEDHVRRSLSSPNDAIEHLCELDDWGLTPRKIIFKELTELTGSSIGPTHEDQLKYYYETILSFIRLSKGAQSLLDFLDGQRIPFGIVTNGGPHQLDKAQAVDLDVRARFVHASDLVGLRKPDPALYLFSAECLEVRPWKVLFVGDRLEIDIKGATAAQMPAVWISHDRKIANKDPLPFFEVANLEGLETALRTSTFQTSPGKSG